MAVKVFKAAILSLPNLFSTKAVMPFYCVEFIRQIVVNTFLFKLPCFRCLRSFFVANYVAILLVLVIKKWLKVAIFMLLNLIEIFFTKISQKFHIFFTFGRFF